jgi:hypothetical protein
MSEKLTNERFVKKLINKLQPDNDQSPNKLKNNNMNADQPKSLPELKKQLMDAYENQIKAGEIYEDAVALKKNAALLVKLSKAAIRDFK